MGNLLPLGSLLPFVLAIVVPSTGTEQQYWKWIHYTFPAAFLGMFATILWGLNLRKKELALEKYFNLAFSWLTGAKNPPDHTDWVAMKVIQLIVNDVMEVSKTKRKEAFDDEDKLIKKPGPSEAAIAETIAKVREYHPIVEKAKQRVADYAALFKFFHFNASE